ncbi:DeHydrogenases, Short chain [Caenorhabditis elegans]|uniref:DeHydrogenases, Short chain n=1 Tax=Caenorhabditis elegans TaxID=6239 RepID=Q7KPV7_CAEEL|nr:DeHydrogenases, Short chain [Caenorhabditis elegans]CCD74373.1 DeHydrogenases, Short chain [Caenorhabditis elegans]|eukprot:NP_001024318.1 Uncharacterized protein CELE_ZK697.14 [Caenorhabditis elegans]
MAPRSILITGANRGIGLGLVKQFLKNEGIQLVIATCRNPSKADELNSIADSRLQIFPLEIDCDDSIKKLYENVDTLVGTDGLTVLINNAAICSVYEIEGQISRTYMRQQIETNSVSTAILTQNFIPLLKKASAKNGGEEYSTDRAAIVNISSGAASIGYIDDKQPGIYIAYRMSKSALNSFSKSCSVELAKYHILVTAMCPGWVKTDMGGENGWEEVDDATEKIMKSILKLGAAQHGAFINSSLEVYPN